MLSQADERRPWGGRTHTEPTLRPDEWQEAFGPPPTVSCGTLRTKPFEHDATPTYKSEASTPAAHPSDRPVAEVRNTSEVVPKPRTVFLEGCTLLVLATQLW